MAKKRNRKTNNDKVITLNKGILKKIICDNLNNYWHTTKLTSGIVTPSTIRIEKCRIVFDYYRIDYSYYVLPKDYKKRREDFKNTSKWISSKFDITEIDYEQLYKKQNRNDIIDKLLDEK